MAASELMMLSSKKSTQSYQQLPLPNTIVGLQTHEGKKLFDYYVAQHQWCIEKDSYLSSYGYYLITGRKGCWLFCQENDALVFCLHPNKPSTLIVFPSFGQNPSMIIKIIQRLRPYQKNIEIGRIHEDLIGSYESAFSGAESTNYFTTDEHTLDWLYPVHCMSITKVLEESGKDLRFVRQKCRQLGTHEVSVSLMNENHLTDIDHLCSVFSELYCANDNISFNSNYLEIYNSNIQAARIGLRSEYLHSYVVKVNESIEGFFIYDLVNNSVANMLWYCSNRNIRGLPYAQFVASCKHFESLGLQFCNFGGSENEGMDRFKRKFCPVASYPLKTIKILDSGVQHMHSIIAPIDTDVKESLS